MKKYELGRVRPEDTDAMDKVTKKMEEEFSISQLAKTCLSVGSSVKKKNNQ